jgi:hypothetical protein
MGKELNAVEINVEILDSAVVVSRAHTELDELSLSLVGGGSATVTF